MEQEILWRVGFIEILHNETRGVMFYNLSHIISKGDKMSFRVEKLLVLYR